MDLNILIPVSHSKKAPFYTDSNKMEIPIEIQVDYADLWYNQYEYFRLRGIKESYFVEIAQVAFERSLPKALIVTLNEMVNAPLLEPSQIRTLQNKKRRGS